MINRLIYKGIPVSQEVKVVKSFENLLSKNKFDIIIEIGTLNGGLTLLLSDLFNGPVVSYDVKEIANEYRNKVADKSNITLYIEDVFESETIVDILTSEKKVLLLCDGGNKIKEVNMFAKYLKPGDVIMAHDYFEARNKFSAEKWTGCEITYDDIKMECIKNNIETKTDFEDVFWFSGTRH